MRLFKKTKETMGTQENRPAVQHDLPKNYKGAYKLLGKNEKTPIEQITDTNTLVIDLPRSVRKLIINGRQLINLKHAENRR